MQDMHQKMQAAKSPAERAKLMDEHMKLMQSGMAMMGRMHGGKGGMGMSGGMRMSPDMMGKLFALEAMPLNIDRVRTRVWNTIRMGR